MPASPDAAYRAFLARASARLRWLAVSRGAAIGFGLAAVVTVGAGSFASLGIVMIIGLGMAGAAAAIAAAMPRRSAADVATLVERRAPASRNLVRTSAELLASPSTTPAYVSDRVLRDAGAFVGTLDLRSIFPARRAVIVALAGVAIWAASLATARGLSPRPAVFGPSTDAAAIIQSVEIEVAPPGYSGQPATRLRDPQRIEVLAGGRVTVRATADAAAVDVETIAGRVALTNTGPGMFIGDVLADGDGFLAIAPRAANGTLGVRRLIGLTVTPDQAPRVRVIAPGRDMVLPTTQRTLSIGLEADDDLGLGTLRLAYTRVSGSGENFTFTGGDVPVTLTKANDRTWKATALWTLTPLALEPGDMVIYRGIATDRRPGAPSAESDAFIVEIAAPGALPSEGFAIDDRQDKYAISQQMVIVKTERLLAARTTLAPADFREQALDLAAEQRQVRAEFVFMMGGELADAGLDLNSLNEEEEAAGEDDLAAGRLVNQGRADLMRAIRAMSRAAARLFDADAAAALPIEKEALTFLQRAFSRSRYILRTLGERERLDLSRRLTGVLAALSRDGRPAEAAATNPRVAALRRALADLAALATDPARETDAGAARAVGIAERLLRIDPAATALRETAATLTTLAAGLRTRDNASNTAAFDDAARTLATIIRAELPSAPPAPTPDLDRLKGAVADALRQGGRR